MTFKSLFASLICMFALAVPAIAQDTDFDPNIARQLSGDEIQSAFSDITHDGVYQFTSERRPSAKYREYYSGDGDVLYSEDQIEDATGRWFVSRDSLCFAYDDPVLTDSCFHVFVQGTCYFHFSRRINPDGSVSRGRTWVARSVPDGTVANCNPLIG